MLSIHLPFPVSVNQIWKKSPKGLYRSVQYTKWLKAADQLFVMHKIGPLRTVEGQFIAVIELAATGKRRKTSDADNLVKVCLDYAERTRLIQNDKFAQWVISGWVDSPDEKPPYGCRLTIIPCQKEGLLDALGVLTASLTRMSRENAGSG